MDLNQRDKFIQGWQKYFPGADLPIVFFYANDAGDAEQAELAGASTEHGCFLGQLGAVRKGESVAFSVDSLVCAGGKRYLGFVHTLRPGFEYFLSCGIPGKLEGERYKKSPEIVKEMLAKAREFNAPAPYIVFKRWDKLDAADDPAVAIFFAKPDVLAGLFTLSGFDESDIYMVIAPFSAGCGSIVQHPYFEQQTERPRAVIGMFDPSAAPWPSSSSAP